MQERSRWRSQKESPGHKFKAGGEFAAQSTLKMSLLRTAESSISITSRATGASRTHDRPGLVPNELWDGLEMGKDLWLGSEEGERAAPMRDENHGHRHGNPCVVFLKREESERAGVTVATAHPNP